MPTIYYGLPMEKTAPKITTGLPIEQEKTTVKLPTSYSGTGNDNSETFSRVPAPHIAPTPTPAYETDSRAGKVFGGIIGATADNILSSFSNLAGYAAGIAKAPVNAVYETALTNEQNKLRKIMETGPDYKNAPNREQADQAWKTAIRESQRKISDLKNKIAESPKQNLEKAADYFAAAAQENTQKAVEAAPKGTKTAVKIAPGVASMLATAAVGGTPALVAESVGSGMQSARLSGGNAGQQLVQGVGSGVGVLVGGAASRAVSASGIQLLRTLGLSNNVLPRVALGAASSSAFAAGSTATRELSKAVSDENYQPDYSQIGESLITAAAFGAITTFINTAKVSGQNRHYVTEQTEALSKRYSAVKSILDRGGYTPETKAKIAKNVIISAEDLKDRIKNLDLVGASKQVNSVLKYLSDIQAEMYGEYHIATTPKIPAAASSGLGNEAYVQNPGFVTRDSAGNPVAGPIVQEPVAPQTTMDTTTAQSTLALAEIQKANPDNIVLGPIGTAFISRANISARAAKRRENIITSLISGQDVTNKTIDKLEPTHPVTKEIFREATGVDIDAQLKSGVEIHDAYRRAYVVDNILKEISAKRTESSAPAPVENPVENVESAAVENPTSVPAPTDTTIAQSPATALETPALKQDQSDSSTPPGNAAMQPAEPAEELEDWEEAQQPTRKKSKKEIANAIKSAVNRVIKNAKVKSGRAYLQGMFLDAGKFVVSDTFRIIRLNNDIDSIPHTEIDGRFSTVIADSISAASQNNVLVNLPVASEVRDFAKEHKQDHAPYLLDGKVYVNPSYLYDMLQALPGSKAYMDGNDNIYAPIYFSAENGDGALLPIRNNPNKNEQVPMQYPVGYKLFNQDGRQVQILGTERTSDGNRYIVDVPHENGRVYGDYYSEEEFAELVGKQSQIAEEVKKRRAEEAERAEREAKAAAERAEQEKLHGYADTLSPMERGRAIKQLVDKWQFDKDGGRITQADWIYKKIQSAPKGTTLEVKPDGHYVDRKGESYLLNMPDNTGFFLRNKTEYKYAKWLLAQALSDETAPESPKAEKVEPKAKTGKSRGRSARNYRSFVKQFPEIANGKYRFLHLDVEESLRADKYNSGFLPLNIERIGENEIAIFQYRTGYYNRDTNREDILLDPGMTFRLNPETGEMNPLSFHQDSNPPVIDEVYSNGVRNDALHADLLRFTEEWLKTISQIPFRKEYAITSGTNEKIYFDEQGGIAKSPKQAYNADKAAETAAQTEEAAENGRRDLQSSNERTADREGIRGTRSEGARTGGLLGEVEAQSREGNEAEGDVLPVAESRRGTAGESGNRSDSSGPLSERSGGNRGGAVADETGVSGRSGEPGLRSGLTEQAEGQAAKLPAETKQKPEANLTLSDERAAKNYVIQPGDLAPPKGPVDRYNRNVEALKLRSQILAENRPATPEEQAKLVRWTGWGALPQAFEDSNPKWAKQYAELKSLLTEEEYEAASASILNAHYTADNVINAIYEGLTKYLGFRGGKLLEPSAGIGHFAGLLPDSLQGKSRWSMVELDRVTGDILKLLYPLFDVRIEGFEESYFLNDSFDAALSNVPFSSVGVVDSHYKKELTSSLHNYFFVKAIDKVRPGGLVAFITSSFTMDNSTKAGRDFRAYMMSKADLLGAIRLPNNAFKANAGTEVVADILVFKKREANAPYAGEKFVATDELVFSYRDENRLGNSIPYNYNRYWEIHPEMVLGTIAKGKMYKGSSVTWEALDTDTPLEKQIADAFSRIKGKMEYPAKPTPELIIAEAQKAERSDKKEGTYTERGGKMMKVVNGELVDASKDFKNSQQREIMKRATTIAEIARELLRLQLSNIDRRYDVAIENARRRLNDAYEKFILDFASFDKKAGTSKPGFFNTPRTIAPIIKKSTDGPFILSLEVWDKKTGTARKADIFTANTVTPVRDIFHVDNLQDGVYASVNKSGSLDAAYIAQLMDRSENDVKNELLKSGAAFLTADGGLELRERYLQGNVRQKLEEAKALAAMDKNYQRNVEALEKIIPKDIQPEQITVTPGVSWIPDRIYSQFVAYILTGNENEEIAHHYSRFDTEVVDSVTHEEWLGFGSIFSINVDSYYKNSPENTSRYGIAPSQYSKGIDFLTIFERTLNNRPIKVTKKVDGKTVTDEAATKSAVDMQEKIIGMFQEWAWKDGTDRRTELARLYNYKYNSFATPTFTGTGVTVDGVRSGYALRPHQENFVYRVLLSNGPVYAAHATGTGKTFATISAIMKLRQTGAVQKPLIVVPKNLLSQWEGDFRKFYPGAKIFAATGDTFSKQNRQTFINAVATGDWDAILLSDSQFYRIPMSAKARQRFYRQELDRLKAAIDKAKLEKRYDMSRKEIEAAKKRLLNKLKEVAESTSKDTLNIEFEALGIDSIVVDEFHNYKNLPFTTRLGNSIAGLGNKTGSERATDMFMKIQYLQKQTGGRGIIFASATPIMNSASEMYSVLRYTMNNRLDELGIYSFDDFCKLYGAVKTEMEIRPDGHGTREKQVLSSYKNVPEMEALYRLAADVVQEIPEVPLPELEGGKMQTEACPLDPQQKKYMEDILERVAALEQGGVDPEEDNMLNITTDARKLSYSARYFDNTLPYEADGKIMRVVRNVKRIWDETTQERGAQVVFCDLATPKAKKESQTENSSAEDDEVVEWGGLDLYNDIKNLLIQRGIPANEIAFIHDAKSDADRTALFEKVNSGEVRVLIGSTSKLGVGANIQERLKWLHHLDCPWRPGDTEQRNGRIVRQGNRYAKVGITAYVTQETFDSRMWQLNERKGRIIYQINYGITSEREFEMGGDLVGNMAEIKAIATGDPLFEEEGTLKNQRFALESAKETHIKKVNDAKENIKSLKSRIQAGEKNIQQLKADISRRLDEVSGDKFKIQIGNKVFTDRKEAGSAIIAEAQEIATNETGTIFDQPKKKEIGVFAGFKLSVNERAQWILNGAGQYQNNINFDSPTGVISSLSRALTSLEANLQQAEFRIGKDRQNLAKYENIAKQPFEQEAELAKVNKRLKEVQTELSRKKSDDGETPSEYPEPETQYSLKDDEEPASESQSPPPEPQQSGLIRNEWTGKNLDGITAAQIDEIARRMGVLVQFSDSIRGGSANASYGNNVIQIEKGNKNPVLFLLGHELLHHLRKISEEAYQCFYKAIASRPEVQIESAALKQRYQEKGISLNMDKATEEAVANFAGNMFDESSRQNNFLVRFLASERNKDAAKAIQKAVSNFVRQYNKAEPKEEDIRGSLDAAFSTAADKLRERQKTNPRRQERPYTDDENRKAFYELGEIYGVMAPAVNQRSDSYDAQNIPLRTTPDTYVGELIRNVMNAKAVPLEFIDTGAFQELLVSGALDWKPISDKSAYDEAVRRITATNNLQGSVASFVARAENGEAYSKFDYVEGLTLLVNQLKQYEDGDQSVLQGILDTTIALNQIAHGAAQTLQAGNILKRLGPAAQVYLIQKTVDGINADRKRQKPETEEESAALEAIREEREKLLKELADLRIEYGELKYANAQTAQGEQDALNVIREAHEQLNIHPPRNHGIPVEEWMSTIGEQVAGIAISRTNGPQEPKPKSITQIIQADLLKFAEDFGLPKKQRNPKEPRTAATRLRDFWANRKNYVEAWNTFHASLREQLKDNPQALLQLDSLMEQGQGLSYNAQSSYLQDPVTAGIIRAILDSDENVKNTAIQAHFNDFEAIETRLYNYVTQTVQPPTQADAQQVKDAIQRYVMDVYVAAKGTIRESKRKDGSTFRENVIDRRIRIDTQKALDQLGVKISKLIRESPGKKAAVASAVAKMLIKDYGVSNQKAENAANMIIARFNDLVARRSQEALNKHFGPKKRTKEQDALLRKFTELANLGAFSSPGYAAFAAKELFGRDTVRISPLLLKNYLDAKGAKTQDKALDKLAENIADQIEPTFGEKFDAWRYLAMLGNLRTQHRNFTSNVFMQPVSEIKNAIQTGLEGLAVKAKWMAPEDRTRSIRFAQKDYLAAREDFFTIRRLIMSGGKVGEYGPADPLFAGRIREARKYFGRNPDIISQTAGKYVEAARWLTNKGMENGDKIFCQHTYAITFARYLRVHGLTMETASPEQLNRAREIAVVEAAEVTFRDNNALAELITQISFKENELYLKNQLGKNPLKVLWNTMLRGILPFMKTPANIGVRGFEYSPMGIATLLYDTSGIGQKFFGTPKFDLAQRINVLSKALTGTALVVVGFFLARLGWLRGHGGDDDDLRKVKEQQGFQQYSAVVGDSTYTLDALAPAMMPVFTGANLYEAVEDGKVGVDTALSILGSMSDVMLQMSFMQGINRAFEDISKHYDDQNSMLRFATNAALSYYTQAFPVVSGQIERMWNNTRMTTYTDKNSAIPTDWQYELASIFNKIPGKDLYQIEYIDAWGRRQKSFDFSWGDATDAILNAGNQIAGLGYQRRIQRSPMEAELERLYKSTGEKGVLPQRGKSYFTVDGVTKYFTGAEYVEYAVARGQKAWDDMNALVQSKEYQKMTDEQRAEAVKDVYTAAQKAAQLPYEAEVRATSEKAKKANADAGITQEQYSAYVESIQGVGSIRNRRGDTVYLSKSVALARAVNAIPGLNIKQRRYLKELAGVGETVIDWDNAKLDSEWRRIQRDAQKR